MNSFDKTIETINTERKAGDCGGVNWGIVIEYANKLQERGFFALHDEIIKRRVEHAKYVRSIYLGEKPGGQEHHSPRNGLNRMIQTWQASVVATDDLDEKIHEIFKEVFFPNPIGNNINRYEVDFLLDTIERIRTPDDLSAEEETAIQKRIHEDSPIAQVFVREVKGNNQLLMFVDDAIQLVVTHKCDTLTGTHYLVTESGKLFVISTNDYLTVDNWKMDVLLQGFKHGTSQDAKNFLERLEADYSVNASILANW